MENLLNTEQAAEVLGVSSARIRAMTNQPCPACNNDPDCQRCRGTGHKLPHTETSVRSGTGTIKLIYPWALDLPDVRDRRAGRPSDLPKGVMIHHEEGTKAIVLLDGEEVGSVYRQGEIRRSWVWEVDGAISEEKYRNRKDAIAVLLKQSQGTGKE